MAAPQTKQEVETTLPDAWDYKGRPAVKSSSGGWTCAAMTLGVEWCQRLTTLSVAVNLVTYLTGTMHLGGAKSANNVTNFLGASFMLCLPGNFIADTYLGRYLAIAIFATVQATGLTILTISTIIPSLRPPKCIVGSPSCIPASGHQLAVLFLALYLTAVGNGGLKSSVSGFGADQFDDSDNKERQKMNTFVSWGYFFLGVAALAAVTVFVYIQDNIGRSWGYGICACAIVLGLTVFLSGTTRYRFKRLVSIPWTQFVSVIVAAWRKRHLELPSDPSLLFDVDETDAGDGYSKRKKLKLPHSKEFRFLDKAAINEEGRINNLKAADKWYLKTLTNVEEVKLVIRMLPTWATTIMFWTVYAQILTFSVSQATTLDRRIGKSFQIPAGSLTIFFVIGIILTVPIYDRIIVPICKRILNNAHGLTTLQRIGIGLAFSILAMVAAALTEINRLEIARKHGLTHDPAATLPASVFMLAPQFLLVGVAEGFTYMGQLDFFLRECPKGMKTMSTGLFLSTLSLGFFLSSALVAVIHRITGENKPWLSDNLNEGKLYNFYWMLAILSTGNLIIFLGCSRSYTYKDKRLADEGIEHEENGGPIVF